MDTKYIIISIIAVVVILLLIGGGVYWYETYYKNNSNLMIDQSISGNDNLTDDTHRRLCQSFTSTENAKLDKLWLSPYIDPNVEASINVKLRKGESTTGEILCTKDFVLDSGVNGDNVWTSLDIIPDSDISLVKGDKYTIDISVISDRVRFRKSSGVYLDGILFDDENVFGDTDIEFKVYISDIVEKK